MFSVESDVSALTHFLNAGLALVGVVALFWGDGLLRKGYGLVLKYRINRHLNR